MNLIAWDYCNRKADGTNAASGVASPPYLLENAAAVQSLLGRAIHFEPCHDVRFAILASTRKTAKTAKYG